MLIDWSLNGVSFEKNQVWVNLIPCTIYFFVNLIVVKASGQVIYPGMTWDSFWSVMLALSAFPIGIGIWFLLVWCSNKKITKFLRKATHEDLSPSLVNNSHS